MSMSTDREYLYTNMSFLVERNGHATSRSKLKAVRLMLESVERKLPLCEPHIGSG